MLNLKEIQLTAETILCFITECCIDSISLRKKCKVILTISEVPGSTQKGNLYYIDFEGIPAHELGKELVITVGDMEITYNPLSYAYIAISRDGIDESLASLMHAMYLYYQAAQEYKVVTNN